MAFLRAADGGAPQLWLLPAGGGDPWPVTTLPLGAGPPAWSPDGSQIAFAGPADRMAVPGEDAAGRARRELVPIVADRLDYLADGSGLTRTTRSHVHVLEVASGDCRQLTEGDWNAGQPAWSPDGSQLAFCAAMDGDADLTRRSAVYVTDVKAPVAAPRLAGTGAGSAWSVGWTADGSALLVTGRLDVTDEPAALLLVPLDGGPAASLSAPLDRSIALGAPGYPGAVPQLTADGAAVLFCVGDRGSTRLLAAELAGGAPRPVIADLDCTISGLSIAGGQAAVVLATATSFGEIATVDLATGQRSVWTAHGAGLAGIELADRVEREFTISDGTVVHGWIMRSPATAGPGPLLLDIHGGPHNSWHPTADDVHLYHHELVARGWTVLLLNPRASDGYGTAFLTAAVGGWGVADARDFLEPIDTLVREGIADPARLAVTGYSYGGYMTCYLTSRDTRFAAAIAGGLISDVTSMAGTADNRRALSDTEFGGTAVGRAAALRQPVAVHHGGPGEHADPDPARRDRRALPVRPGPAVAHRAARAGRAGPPGHLPRRLAPVRGERAAIAPAGLQPPRR